MRIHRRTAQRIDQGIVAVLLAAGLLSAQPVLWYQTAAITWLTILTPILVGGWLFQRWSLTVGERIQGERTKPAPIAHEIFETSRAMLVVALMAAWPITRAQLGHATGYVWTPEEMAPGGWPMMILLFGVGILGADAWTYWKHRLLHSKALFAFHADHHTFRDPTCFSGFAIGPLEAVLTFWPLLLTLSPAFPHYVPAYVGLIAAFVTLNLYLHCGVRIGVLERVLGTVGLNTSAHHNPHHSRTLVNFGEVSWLWDRICGTREVDVDARRGRGRGEAPGRPAPAK